MRYLPIYPEKSWDEVVTGYPYPRDGPAWEGLPITNTFLGAARWFSQDARRAKDPLTRTTDMIYWLWSLWWSVLVWPVTDTIWNIWNTALNWYKRLYNYWANAYNNIADAYNNWLELVLKFAITKDVGSFVISITSGFSGSTTLVLEESTYLEESAAFETLTL